MAVMEPIDGSSPLDNLICPRCGASLPPDARFCSSCGEPINKQKSEQAGGCSTPGDAEVDDEETLRHVAISRATGESLLQKSGRAGRTQEGSSLPSDREAPLSNNAPTDRGGMRPWLLAHSLVQRVRHHLLLRNSIFIMATNGVGAAFGYLFWILAAHTYSATDIGLGAALISVVTLAANLADLGIGATLVQVLPRREAGRAWSVTLNAGLVTGTLAGLLGGAILLGVLPLFGFQFAFVEHNAGYILAILLGVPIINVSSLLDQAFIAERAAHNMLLRGLAVAVLKIPLLLLPILLIIQVGALGILLPGIVAMAVMLIVGLLLLLPRLGRAYMPAVRGIVGQVRSMLSSLAGNQFINLGGMLPYYLLPVFVTTRLSPADNAYYYTSMRLAEFFTLGSYAVSMSLFAEGSHAAHNLPRIVRSSALIITAIIAPAMLFCFLAGHYILLLFGPSYAQHGLGVFLIFVASTIPDAITNIYLAVLRIQRRLRFAAVLNISMGAIILVLAWVLLPVLGIAGAALAFVISQVVGSLVAAFDAIRYRRHPDRFSDAGVTQKEGSNQLIEDLPGEVTY